MQQQARDHALRISLDKNNDAIYLLKVTMTRFFALARVCGHTGMGSGLAFCHHAANWLAMRNQIFIG